MKYHFKPMQSEDEWKWATERTQATECEDTKGILALNEYNDIVAATIMDSWSYNSVIMHIAVDDIWCFKHGYPEEVFNYVFNTAGKGIAIGITPGDNPKALSFNKRIGFEVIYRIRDGYKVGIDYVVQEFRKENCKYLRNRYGQEIHSRAA